MKFLVDNQLPPALARFISQDLEAEAHHITDWVYEMRTILKFGVTHRLLKLILISRDEDFLHLRTKEPVTKLRWVRLGNCRRAYLLEVFRLLWPNIIKRFASGDEIVELR